MKLLDFIQRLQSVGDPDHEVLFYVPEASSYPWELSDKPLSGGSQKVEFVDGYFEPTDGYIIRPDSAWFKEGDPLPASAVKAVIIQVNL